MQTTETINAQCVLAGEQGKHLWTTINIDEVMWPHNIPVWRVVSGDRVAADIADWHFFYTLSTKNINMST